MAQNKSSKPDNRLPDKLSELIEVALMDLILAEQMKEYEIDMGAYHVANGKCRVCFAGSVIAATNNFSLYNRSIHPCQTKESFKYYALNQARQYSFISALNCLGVYEYPLYFVSQIKVPFSNQVSYEFSPELFKANMETAAAILKKYDL